MTAAELAGSIEIQTLDNAGRTVDSYIWNGEGWEGDEGKVFEPGCGFSVVNSVGNSDAVALQSTGKVSTSDVVVALDTEYGATYVANTFPVKVALADLVPECESLTAEELAGSIEIQTVDNAGLTVDSFIWNGEGWEGDDNTTFAAGAGLSVINSIGAAPAVFLRIPAPEL